jgi:hypothetical protein
MSLAERINKGKRERPFLGIAYGPDGVGKSSFGASAPKPIFIGGEKGIDNLDVFSLKTPTLEAFHADLDDLTNDKHEFESLALDSADWLEPLVWEFVCRKNSWKDIEDPGYGKGYAAALDEWRNIIRKLDKLRDTKNMNIIVLAHSQVKQFNDPTQLVPYDRYQLKLNEKAAALLREWVDFVLFINYEIFVKTESSKAKKGKAMGEDKRIIFTTRMPSYDAKNRFGLPAELELAYPNGFENFMSCVRAPRVEKTLEQLQAEVTALVPQVKDEATRAKITAALATVAAHDLSGYIGRIQEIINTQDL